MRTLWGHDHATDCTVDGTSLLWEHSVPLSAGRALCIACLWRSIRRVQGNPPHATVTQLHLGTDKHLPDPRYAGYMHYLTQWARWHTCNRLALFFFLGAFAKLRKASSSFVVFVLLSARLELGSHWTDFHEVSSLIIWRKSVDKIQFPLKSDKNNGCFARRPTYIFYDISLNSS
jgi:hypothetical protein